MITLKTLHLATKEEVFQQVKSHLLTQKKKSMNSNTCKYRFDVLKCAAGCLIGEDEYKSEMEYNSWNILVDLGLVPNYHKNLIKELQNIHDFKEVYKWEEELNKIDLNEY